MWMNAKKKCGKLDIIDLQQRGIIYLISKNIVISALAAVMCMENKRKHFQAVVFRISTHTLIQPYAGKLEEALPNTNPCVCPAGVSDREIA